MCLYRVGPCVINIVIKRYTFFLEKKQTFSILNVTRSIGHEVRDERGVSMFV